MGKQKRMSLGSYPQIGLKEARICRDDARALVAQGISPYEHRRVTPFLQAISMVSIH